MPNNDDDDDTCNTVYNTQRMRSCVNWIIRLQGDTNSNPQKDEKLPQQC